MPRSQATLSRVSALQREMDDLSNLPDVERRRRLTLVVRDIQRLLEAVDQHLTRLEARG